MARDDLVKALADRLASVEAKVATMESEGKDEPWMQAAATWLPEAFHEQGTIGGIVVDEGKARESDCRCIPLGTDSQLCYSKGVVGALSKDQEQLYCPTTSMLDLPPAMVERQRILRDAAVMCQGEVQHLSDGERIEPFMRCISKQAKRNGIEL